MKTLLVAAVLSLLQTTAFNSLWQFFKGEEQPAAEAQWRTLDLPHDWGVEGPFDIDADGSTGKLPWMGTAWYRKSLEVSAEDLQGEVFLDFGGVMSGAEVFCNGQSVCRRPYGYSSFRAVLTPSLKEGSNPIVVKVVNPDDSSRWYPGGGIYRNVYLVKAPKAGFAHYGVSVTAGSAAIFVKTDFRGESTGDLEAVLTLDGEVIGSQTIEDVKVADGESKEFGFFIKHPKTWSPESPVLYDLKVTVTTPLGNETVSVPVGLRDAKFRPDGFYLNGEKTFLKGVCLHHDAGALGAAWNEGAWIRRLLKLKEMGCNAIRTSHNPPAPELLDLCDRLGFLVIDELTDTWTVPKRPNGYATLFDEWAEKDLTDMILRDRNHPSVILWSIGNEVGEQGYPDKYHIAAELSVLCHRLDPSRKTTSGNDNLWASETDWRFTTDVYGFNYKPHAYEDFRKANPGKPFYGSETASTISTRGFYVFPVTDDKSGGQADFQMSSYDLYAPWWASCPDYEWGFEDKVPECAGEFVWTGFDYLGEPTPYNSDVTVLTNFHDPAERAKAEKQLEELGKIKSPSRSSYFGIFDLAGFPKDRFWLYQARWRPDLPSAHILPHWTWPGREGEVTPVHVYTSGDRGELFINGVSQGVREKAPGQYRLRWDETVYEPGTVSVKVWKDGEPWAEDKVETAGEPRRIVLKAEERYGDLVFVTAAIVDRRGRLCPDADNLIEFSLRGKGQIVATDAGDPTSLEPFSSTSIKAFHGLTSVILRPEGRLILRARSDGLRRGRCNVGKIPITTI